MNHIAAEFAAEGISEEALERVKGAVRGGLVMAMESVVARMSRLGGGETSLGEVIPLDVYLDRIRSVTSEDVQRVAADVFSSQSCVSVVGPVDIA